MPRWWWLLTWWTLVLATMGKTVDAFLRGWLPWLADISPEYREFLYWVVPITLGLILALFKWVFPAVKKLHNRLWARRELAKPREHELGYHDHRGRLKKLWVRLSYLRADVYELLTGVGKLTNGVKEKKDTAPAQFWSALAARMEPSVRRLEKAADEMSELTARMLSSFQAVCGRSTQASVDALRLFTENDPIDLQWQMKEDAMLLFAAKLQFNALKGEKFELNRVCGRIDG